MSTSSKPAIALALFAAALTSAAAASDATICVPVRREAAARDEVTTLQISVAIPVGQTVVVTTSSGETIGSIVPYGGSGRRTYTLAVPAELTAQSLRTIKIRTGGERLPTQAVSAVLMTPRN